MTNTFSLAELLPNSDIIINLLENKLSDGIIFYKQESDRFNCNEKFAQHFGFKGKNTFNLKELLSEQDFNLLHTALKQKQSFNQAIEFNKQSGYKLWMEAKITYLKEDSNDALITLQDITPFKEKEEFMLQCNSEARIGYWEYDLTKNSLYWSDVTREIMGVSKEESPTLEEGLSIYKEGWSLSRINEVYQRAITQGEPYKEELIIVNKSGEERWVRSIGIPIFHQDQCINLYGTFQDIHEEKQQQLKLAQQEKKFRGILNSTFAFIGFLDKNGVLLEANDTALEMAGIHREDVYGKFFWDCYWWQVSEQTKQQLKDSIDRAAAGEEVSYEAEVYVANKEIITILFSLRPVLDEKGKVQYIIPEGRPIQELVETRNRYKNVIEGTDAGIWEWNVQTGETIFNERWAEIVGYTLEELAPIDINTWMKLAHPKDLEESNKNLTDCFEKRSEFYEAEVRMKHKDGYWVWVHDKGKVISWTEDGKPLMMFGTHQDISQRKYAESQLKIREEAFREMFEQASIGMTIVSLQGEFNQVNPALCKILGYDEKELLQLSFQEITHPEDLNKDIELLQETIEGKRNSYQMEKRYFHKDGRTIQVILSVSAVYDRNEQVAHFISQIVDVTQLKAFKEELKQINLQLNEKNKELEQFNYIAAHDLKEPLRSISSFIGMLEKKYSDRFDEKGMQYLHFIKDGAERMKSLIDSLLKYSRTGIHDLESFDLNELLNDIKSSLLAIEANKGAAIIIDDFPEVTADKDAFKQLFTNLISNGLKYQEADNVPKIELRAKQEDNHWVFQVKDNGIGISKENHQSIFDMFKRLHKKTDYEGTGVGLASCKKIVLHYQGEIWVESEKGKGSTFFIHIPKSSI